MRYLKRYENVKHDQDLVDLTEFCEINLAYLADRGFLILINDSQPYLVQLNKSIIWVIHEHTATRGWNMEENGFKWSEVKDYIIPFISILMKRHHIDLIGMNLFNQECFKYSADDVLQDNIDIDDKVSPVVSISITVSLD
jgi:hypothetical protein